MNILYSGDKNIAEGLVISLLSLMDNTSEPLNVFVLTMDYKGQGKVCEPLPDAFGKYMNNILKKNNKGSSLTLIDVSEHFRAEVPDANINTRFTPGCMLRLFADRVSEIPSKILYLDNDVVCRGDISELYNIDMSGTEVAGVPDHYGKWFFRRNIFRMDYMNSGVLLLNMDEIRRNGLFTRCRQMCREKKMFMPDQSAINKLCTGRILFDRKYNEQRKLHSDTVLQHFTTSFRFFPYFHSVTVKPWHFEKMHSELKLYCYDELITKAKVIYRGYESQH